MAARPSHVVAEHSPMSRLTEMQKKFVKHVVVDGMSNLSAARAAGYSHPDGATGKLMRIPEVHAAIKWEQQRNEKVVLMTKKRVMEGFLSAIEQAKIMADPIAQISGWREIARMCGYFAPVKHELNVNVSGGRALQQLETMTDQQLLELAESQGDIIEGESERVAA